MWGRREAEFTCVTNRTSTSSSMYLDPEAGRWNSHSWAVKEAKVDRAESVSCRVEVLGSVGVKDGMGPMPFTLSKREVVEGS